MNLVLHEHLLRGRGPFISFDMSRMVRGVGQMERADYCLVGILGSEG